MPDGSATAEAGNLPGVAELAEQIKALKAAHSLDAAPTRACKRGFAAEEPVTARLRNRAARGGSEDGKDSGSGEANQIILAGDTGVMTSEANSPGKSHQAGMAWKQITKGGGRGQSPVR